MSRVSDECLSLLGRWGNSRIQGFNAHLTSGAKLEISNENSFLASFRGLCCARHYVLTRWVLNSWWPNKYSSSPKTQDSPALGHVTEGLGQAGRHDAAGSTTGRIHSE